MEKPDHGREPCPWRILEDSGAAFAMGAIGASFFHAYKGAKNSPRGERMHGSLMAIKTRAPITGGSFAVWGGTFSAFDCTFAHLRGREDPWNPIMSGFVTGGVLAMRAGPKTAVQSAVIGGVLLAIIEGVSIGINRMVAEQFRPVAPELPQGTHLPPTQLPKEPKRQIDEFATDD